MSAVVFAPASMAADGASSAPEPGATRRARGRDAGYLAATSIRYEAATPHGRYALPRIAVYWGESLATFGSRMCEAVARAH